MRFKSKIYHYSGKCFTTVLKEGKQAIGNECKLPFIHKGIRYNGCTLKDSNDNQPWCSLAVDKKGVHLSGQGSWGHCGYYCPKKFYGRNRTKAPISN